MQSRFNVFVDCDEKKETLLEMGWMMLNGWTDCPRYIYDKLDEQMLADYFLSEEGETDA